MMRRREFITFLGSAAAGWPLAAGAQQPRQMRRIAAIFDGAADDPETQVRVAGFLQGLAELGWRVGQNVRIDYRWASNNDPDRIHGSAAEVLTLAPDVIFATTGTTVAVLQQLTRNIPIVFVGAIDPVAGGRIASLARPGTNVTGFMSVEYGISTKLPEVLKEIAPGTTRAVVVAGGLAAPGEVGQYGATRGAAPSFGVEVTAIDLRDRDGVQPAIIAFAREPNGGLIVPVSALAVARREEIIVLAARHALPAVYGLRAFVSGGGLISYGPVMIDLYRQAASYVDRILKGEKPADLPVQAPTKYEMVINLKTAKALGITVPITLLGRADEVIE